MKILVTNDDGILSEGLALLTKQAAKLGETWVAAPTAQQSGKSHAINIHEPISVEERHLDLGERAAFAVGSTPVDCVRFATLGLKIKFDLILSGINRGYNLGEDILYSGTVGALFEGALQNTPSVAFSAEYTSFKPAEGCLERIFDFLLGNKLFEHNLAYNVNIPPQAGEIVITRQGGAYFSDEWQNVGGGLWKQEGFCVHKNTHDISLDTDATVDGFITVTPMTTDRSDRATWKKLRARFGGAK